MVLLFLCRTALGKGKAVDRLMLLLETRDVPERAMKVRKAWLADAA
jgi:hypothetical protein